MKDRVPPHNIEAEEALLGSMIIDTDAVREVSEIVKPEDFYRHQNGWIYESILSLREVGTPIDLITLTDDLRKKDGRLEQMGGEAYLISLINTVPTSINADSYAKIVADASVRRTLISRASTIANIAYEEGVDLNQQLVTSEAAITDLTRSRTMAGDEVKTGMDMATDYLAQMKAAAANGSEMSGLATGFLDLDMLTKGLSAPQMYLIAGRPSMGKSSLLLCIVAHIAIDLGKRVMFFSLEMSAKQVMDRIIAARTGIGLSRLRSAKLNREQWLAVGEVAEQVSKSGLIVDDTTGIKPSQARARAYRQHDREPLDLTVYDHVGLMESDRYSGNPNKEIGDNSFQIFKTNKELDVPSLVAAQLSRKVEERRDRRPQLADLRDSGELEQNAYGVMFVYRDEYYHRDESDRVGLAEINMAKHRDGATGTVELAWLAGTASFANIKRWNN